MPKVTFSTVMVEPSDVNLAASQWIKYAVPKDRSDDFLKIVGEELQHLKTLFREHGDEKVIEALIENPKPVKILRHFRALQRANSIIELIKAELSFGAYKKALIYAHHRDVIQWYQISLGEYFPVTIYAKSNPHKAEQNIKNFQNPKHKCRVLLSTILAAKDPLSFNASNHIFFAEEELEPEHNADAIMRTFGQENDQRIYARNFCLNDTVDKRIQEIIRKKTKDVLRNKIGNDLETSEVGNEAVI